MNYTVAWLVIVAAGLLGTGLLFLMTRTIRSAALRWTFRVLPLVLMTVPAPVPNYEGQLAPAFIVLTFESLFQTEGEPGTAAGILLAGVLLGVALGLLLGRVTAREAVKPEEQEQQ